MTDNQKLETILKKYRGADREILIPVLQEVQESLGYLSKEAVVAIGKALSLPASKIYGVATFYNQFRFQKQGRCHVQICRGTACHVKGSQAVLNEFEKKLGIQAGQTSSDGKFSLEVVACIGACGLAPVITANGKFHARIMEDDVDDLISGYSKELNADEEAASDNR
jgi:NADH-quinone oxidoreductase subunit E